jgi:hypothetical protein
MSISRLPPSGAFSVDQALESTKSAGYLEVLIIGYDVTHCG